MVSENLEQVKANIEAACKRVGRDPKETKPISLIDRSQTFRENVER